MTQIPTQQSSKPSNKGWGGLIALLRQSCDAYVAAKLLDQNTKDQENELKQLRDKYQRGKKQKDIDPALAAEGTKNKNLL